MEQDVEASKKEVKQVELQDIFYTLGIIVMVSWLIFVAAVIYFLWKIHQAISNVKRQAFDKVGQVIAMNKGKIAGAVSATVLTVIGNRIRSFFNR